MKMNNYSLIKKFFQKFFLCLGISALAFWYFDNTYEVENISFITMRSLMLFEFFSIYFLNVFFSFERLNRYILLFQSLIVLLSLIFGFYLYFDFFLFGITIFKSLAVAMLVVILSFFIAAKYGETNLTNESFGLMRHLFFLSLILPNFQLPAVISKIISIMYILCMFVIFNYYFYYAYNMVQYNNHSDHYIETMSNFLLLIMLPGSHFLCISSLRLFY